MQSLISPQYTSHPAFPDMISAMLAALIIAVCICYAQEKDHGH
jgi:hypothetical protein